MERIFFKDAKINSKKKFFREISKKIGKIKNVLPIGLLLDTLTD